MGRDARRQCAERTSSLAIKVPDTYGHHVKPKPTDSIILVPSNPIFPGVRGTAQLQVAPERQRGLRLVPSAA